MMKADPCHDSFVNQFLFNYFEEIFFKDIIEITHQLA